MGGRLTLHWENVQGWFEMLSKQLDRRHGVSMNRSVTSPDQWWQMICFHNTTYQLRLYELQYNAHYIVVLCEQVDDQTVAYRAWSLADEKYLSAESRKDFCEVCVKPHVIEGGDCSACQTTSLVWNDPTRSDGENVDGLIRQLIGDVRRELDGLLAPA